MKKGDLLQIPHGPFVAQVVVEEVTDRGAVCRYTGRATFIGWSELMKAPDGTELTTRHDQGFIGRAHFAQYDKP